MNWFINIILQALNFFYIISGNYGLAIILLTIAINIALYPLTLSSIVQMAAIQKIQPKINEIQKKHKEKPDQMQKEIMEIYKKERINPLGGCLPLLLKIPFLIALFVSLQSQEFIKMINMAHGRAGFLWINNLAKPDPYYILIILIAATTYFAQKTMPGSGQQQTAGMMLIMPIFIAIISISFPSGVQIYWVISNLVAIAQQIYIAKYVSRETF